MVHRLRPGLRLVWRGAGSVQVGTSPRRAVVLDGVTRGDARLLAGLAAADVLGGVRALSLHAGVPADRARRLLDLLADADVVTQEAGLPRPTSPTAVSTQLWATATSGSTAGTGAARRTARVAVRGSGPTAQQIASLLRACGVTVEDPPERDPAAASAASVVVLVACGAVHSDRWQPLIQAGITHLAVVERDLDVVVGPLVVPGHTPCLRCLDLHRQARDPAWAVVAAQLAALPAADAFADPVLSAAAGAIAAAALLRHLGDGTGRARHGVDDGESPGLATTVEVGLPDLLPVRRRWSSHAACGCRWPPDRGAPADPGVAANRRG